MTLNKLKVHKMYPSIQGEGRNAGSVKLIVRLFGCNCSCSFCDSPQESFTEYTTKELSDLIEKYGMHVLWTGGEPSLQEELIHDCRTIVSFNIDFDIETNGLKILEYPQDYEQIIVSPKDNITETCSIYKRIGFRYDNVIFKFVVDTPQDVKKHIENISIDQSIIYAQRQAATYDKDLEFKFIQDCIKYNINYSPRIHLIYNLE